ncbi:hypothetical protein L3X07_07420 [Levilactobacillus brevis]|nr:hypothetical protein [Levilactobacillus brevis]
MADGKWHHLSIDYTAATSSKDGVMKYTYNDKNPDTGAQQTTGLYYGDSSDNLMSQKVNITPSKLGASALTQPFGGVHWFNWSGK